MIKAVIFDLGHTIMDELKGRAVPLRSRPIHLMPGVAETIPRLKIDLGIWANTKKAGEAGVRHWLKKAKLDAYFKWVVTSSEAGYRKPAAEFFDYALRECGLGRSDALFIGNQLNTDIKGANDYGIANVWLAGSEYRSPDDSASAGQITPTYVIDHIADLPQLLARLKVVDR